MTARTIISLAALLATFAAPAVACPICDSDTAEQVRAGLADGNLPLAIVAVAAPFVVIAGVVAIVHFGGAPSHATRRRR